MNKVDLNKLIDLLDKLLDHFEVELLIANDRHSKTYWLNEGGRIAIEQLKNRLIKMSLE